jgi:hypothetical protein
MHTKTMRVKTLKQKHAHKQTYVEKESHESLLIDDHEQTTRQTHRHTATHPTSKAHGQRLRQTVRRIHTLIDKLMARQTYRQIEEIKTNMHERRVAYFLTNTNSWNRI